MKPTDVPPPDQTVLFRYRHGGRVRLMARTAGTLGLLVALTAGGGVLRAGAEHGFAQLSPTSLLLAAVVGLCGLGFALLACRFTREFVTQLEIWPRSCLAVVRTAGCWREQISLVGWNEFRTGGPGHRTAPRDPLLRVQLRSGRRLAFDQDRGEAPNGWIALHRFLEKCSVPEGIAAPLVTSGADEATTIAERSPAWAELSRNDAVEG